MTDDSEVAKLFDTMSKSFHSRMQAMPREQDIVSYSNCFVAFLDILGFKEIIKEIAATSPNDLFHTIVNSYWFHSASEALNFQIISDSVVVSSKMIIPPRL